MGRTSGTTLQALLQGFFLQRMMQQRNMSSRTVGSYRDAFRIYLRYLSETHDLAAPDIEISHFDREYLLGFIAYLSQKRNNKATTINNRLAALRSFLAYVLEEAPEYSAIAKRGMGIPSQKYVTPVMDFITKIEFENLLAACDATTAMGARDKLMLMILYNTGVRVSELVGLRCSDLNEGAGRASLVVKIIGKGRKERVLPLWKTTSAYIRKYLDDFSLTGDDPLFRGRNGEALTRSGIRFRIDKLVSIASSISPTLSEKNISAHTFRHSVAMNLLTSGVDISSIAIWLGHESIETTHKYMVADMELKRKALESMSIPNDASYSYKPSQDLIRFLDSL